MCERLNNLRNMKYYSAIKKEWISHTLNNLDESPENYIEWGKSSQKLDIKWSPFYKVFEMKKYTNREQVSGCHSLRMREGQGRGTINGNMSNFCSDRNTLYSGFISICILAMIWYYSFARWYPWGKLG